VARTRTPRHGSMRTHGVVMPAPDQSGHPIAERVVREGSPPAGPGSGDVSGPGASTDNAIARWDGVAGATLQNSTPLVQDDGRISLVTNPSSAQDAATKDYVDGLGTATAAALAAAIAPTFVVMANTGALANERRLQAVDGITLTDGGAGGDATIGVHADNLTTKLLTAANPFLQSSGSPVSSRAFSFGFGDRSADLTVGDFRDVYVPVACTIVLGVLSSPDTGDVEIDVLVASYAAFPTFASIAAAAPLTLSGADKSKDATLTGWTLPIAADSWVRLEVLSVSGITQLAGALVVTV
jgi:hypothetical protein